MTALLAVLPAAAGRADNVRATPNLMGQLGLNTIPNARVDAPGTIRAGIASTGLYTHQYLGLQLATPLYVGLRQTLQTSDPFGKSDNLLPGVDIKLRLREETAHGPEISLGLQSAFGHKRMAGEYIAASKRMGDFDLTGGLGWGRFAGPATASNPLAAIGGHFNTRRSIDGQNPSEPDDWFTGDDMAFFAGLEYFPPVLSNKLSFKVDWTSERYKAEQWAIDYDPPRPWSAGATWRPLSWLTAAAGTLGGDEFFSMLSLNAPLGKWPRKSASATLAPELNPSRSSVEADTKAMIHDGAKDDLILYDVSISSPTAASRMILRDAFPTPQQIGRAARYIANDAGKNVEEIAITPTHLGLRGPEIRMMRADFERALITKQGSPQEIWRNTRVEKDTDRPGGSWFSRIIKGGLKPDWEIVLDNKLSVSEEDTGPLYRTSAIVQGRQQTGRHFITGLGLRVNIKDNLEQINDYGRPYILPTRGNVDQFAKRTLELDHFYYSFLTSVNTDLHVSLTAGHLEEMYMGYGGEILYRPYGRTFAVGAEAWQVFKRDPNSSLSMGLSGDHLWTGHVNAWYEIPNSDYTLHARFGRYLAEDVGGTLELQRELDNGVKLAGFATITDKADYGLVGGMTHIYGGVRLSMPLGDFKYVPDGSRIKLGVEPQGRNTGQSVEKPLPLYEISEAISKRHITRHWPGVVD